MKYLIYALILFFPFLNGCEKLETEIAPKEELSAISYDEIFICQPLAYDDHLISLINRNSVTSLCNYDEHGNRLWQNSVDQYIMKGFNFSNIDNLSLDKAQNGDFVLQMFVPTINSVNSQNFKTVSFDSNGNFKWQIVDEIHQHDTIIIAKDTIALKEKFIAAGMIHLKDGNHIELSSQSNKSLDSTYIQLSTYNSSGVFNNDQYLKIKGIRLIKKVFLTSDQKLAMFVTNGSATSYLLMDLSGNIIFELVPTESISINYFFYENAQGNLIVSASYFDNASNFKGIVFCFDKAGKILWTNDLQGPETSIITSVQEKTDGYIFSGFNTESVLTADIDWRNTFTQNKSVAIVQKADIDGQKIWEQPLLILDNTAGAATIGSNQITLFSGKFLNSIKNVVILKLDNENGNILN